MNTRIVTSALLALGLVTLAGTAPAHAAVGALPEGQTMYAISCDNGPMDNPVSSGTLFSVDPATGVLTRVGDGTPGLDSGGCGGQGATNPIDNTFYYNSWDYPGMNSALATMDFETGLSTLVGEFTLDGVPLSNVLGVAIDSQGNAFATGWRTSVPGTVLLRLNLTDATTEVVGELPQSANAYALAFDPNDNLYIIDSGASNKLLNINTADASVIDESTALSDFDGIYSMAFDADGTLWMQSGIMLLSADPNDFSVRSELVGFTLAGSPDYDYWTESLAIIGDTPAPTEEEESESETGGATELAATGAGNTTAIAGFALVGIALALIATRTARRTRA